MILLEPGDGQSYTAKRGLGGQGLGQESCTSLGQRRDTVTRFSPFEITNAGGKSGFIDFLPLQPLKQGLQREIWPLLRLPLRSEEAGFHPGK